VPLLPSPPAVARTTEAEEAVPPPAAALDRPRRPLGLGLGPGASGAC
jgi:hypothetical protein